MQLDLLDGLTPDRCGLDRHHANPSQLQGRGKEQMTRDTSGLSGSISSESADLQSYLVNRLAQRLDTDGLIPCKKTWKQVTTPLGRSLSRLQVSVLPTRETDCGLWPTASARDHKGGYQGGRIRDGKWSTDTLDVAVQLTAWPTVTTQDNVQVTGQYSKTNGTTLGGAVRQCSAKTEKSGSSQLNPRFSLWLMGYPIEWAYCGEQVTR